MEDEEELEEQYFPVNSMSTFPVTDHLSSKLVPEDLFSDKPGKTKLLHHNIRLLVTEPIRQTHYRVSTTDSSLEGGSSNDAGV